MRKVFQRFREARLKLNPEKCQLFHKELRCLGHISRNKNLCGNGQSRRISTKLEAFWAYVRITDGLFPVSPIL
jgi:hypothetical protein